jgi:hypothetical protein
MLYSNGIHLLKRFQRWVCRFSGLRLGCCASFKLFWPLALVQQALPAIILQALRRLRGACFFAVCARRQAGVSRAGFWV